MIVFHRIKQGGEDVSFAYKVMWKVACSSILRSLGKRLGFEQRGAGYLNMPWHKVNNDFLLQHPEAFRFTFVRNPWDRLVSCWANRGRRYRFDWYARRTVQRKITDPHSSPQWPQVHVDGQPLFTFIGRFEMLSRDWAFVQRRIGAPPLDWINKSDHKHYSEYYSPQLRDLVAEFYKDDIEQFGYHFEVPDVQAKQSQ